MGEMGMPMGKNMPMGGMGGMGDMNPYQNMMGMMPGMGMGMMPGMGMYPPAQKDPDVWDPPSPR